MAQVPYTSLYLGPFAVYTSPTGMQSPITNQTYLGGALHEGDYVDLQANEAAVWNIQFGVNLFPGRYRFVRLSPNAVAADVAFGIPVGYGLGTYVAKASVAAGGTGYTITATGASSGTVAISSSAAGGTAATANITLAAGVITSAQLTYAGANMTSVPTFTLTSVLSSGSGGSLLAEQFISPNFVSSLDGTSNVGGSILIPRAVTVATSVTAAQVTAGAWILIQELGIANVLVTTATAALPGNMAYVSAAGGQVTTNTAAFNVSTIGTVLDIPTSGAISRVNLTLPVVQG
jgi:hypothetical protein